MRHLSLFTFVQRRIVIFSSVGSERSFKPCSAHILSSYVRHKPSEMAFHKAANHLVKLAHAPCLRHTKAETTAWSADRGDHERSNIMWNTPLQLRSLPTPNLNVSVPCCLRAASRNLAQWEPSAAVFEWRGNGGILFWNGSENTLS